MTVEQQMITILKRNIKNNYKVYLNNFKATVSLETLISEPYKAMELAFIKECHYFFTRDIEYNYDLFKSVYDKAFTNGFNEFNNVTLYDYLVINFKKKNSFDFQCWDCLTEFFKEIIGKGE